MNVDQLRWRAAYETYLRSARWRNIRADMIRVANKKCQRCKQRRQGLQVHHLTYKRLGAERMSDLQVLCEDCHMRADAERDIAQQEKRERESRERVFDAGLNTYASKKYGENWQDTSWACDVEEEFYEWLESRQ